MKKFLLIILLLIITSPQVLADRITNTVSDKVFQSIYGETREQLEKRNEDKSNFYKNELSKPLFFGKKGYFKRLKQKRILRKKLKRLNMMKKRLG